MMHIRPIRESDDSSLAPIIRSNLAAFGLAIPGTAAFDPETDHLSVFYGASSRRAYFVVEDDDDGRVLGGAGIAEMDGDDSTAELQKLYLDDAAKGHGLGYRLIGRITTFALAVGYRRLYLETHHALEAANHTYRRSGFILMDGPLPGSVHGGAMDRFYIRALHDAAGSATEPAAGPEGNEKRHEEGRWGRESHEAKA